MADFVNKKTPGFAGEPSPKPQTGYECRPIMIFITADEPVHSINTNDQNGENTITREIPHRETLEGGNGYGRLR